MTWFNGKNIVVPFDFSDECIRAADMALQLAEQPGHVTVVHVLLELPATDPAVVWNEANDERRKKLVTESIAKVLEEHQVRGANVRVLIGDPARAVTKLAAEVGAGLIVIPSHNESGIKRWFLGSVAERVVRQAKCPTLVLKQEE